MGVRIVQPEVELIGHTARRDPAPHPRRRADAFGADRQTAASAARMCFDGATEVLTDLGWRRFSALTRGERVATLNAETWNIEYHRPTDYFEYDCDEPLFVVRSPYVNLAVTGEHWLYVAGSGERGYRLRRTAEAASRSLRFLRGGHWNGERPGRASAVGEIGGSRVRLSASASAGRAASPALGVRARSVPLAPFLAFLGRYLATGVCYAPPGGPGRVVMPRAAATLELVGACGFSARTRRGQVLIEDAPLYDYLGGLGESHSKRIPRPLLELDADSLHILRGALFQGRRRFSTPSPQLAGDIQELLLKTGSSGNCSQTRPGRYAVDSVEEWTPLVRRGPRLDASPSGGRVWCVTVPNHIIYVRREGIPVWVGNCGPSPKAFSSLEGEAGVRGSRDGEAVACASATLAIRGISNGLAQALVRRRDFSCTPLSGEGTQDGGAGAGAGAAGSSGGEREGERGDAAATAAVPQPSMSRDACRDRSPARARGRAPARPAPADGLRYAVTAELSAWAALLDRRQSAGAEPEFRCLAEHIWPVLHRLAPEVFPGFPDPCAADARGLLAGSSARG